MLAYIVKRLLLMIPTLIGITLVTFLMIRLAPGDPVQARFGAGGLGIAASEGGAEGSEEREKQILKAKVRLGLMQEKGTIRSWDTQSGAPGALASIHSGEVRALAHSPIGNRFASASSSGEVFFWDAATLKKIGGTEQLTAGANALAYHPKGTLLAAACEDRMIHLWRLDAAGLPTGAAETLSGHEGLVLSLAFNPAGDLLASGGKDKTVRVWDLRERRLVATLEKHYQDVTSVVFSRDGSRLISASRDREIHVWDVASHALLYDLPSPGSAILCLAIEAAGNRLAAGLSNNTIAIYDLDRRERISTLTGHAGAVTAVAFHPAEQKLLSASKDKSLLLWDLPTGRSVAALTGHGAEVLAAAFNRDGAQILSAAVDTTKVGLFPAYLDWISRLVRLDFGNSFKDSRPVRDKLAEAVPISLKLNLIAIFITYLLSLPIGVLAAARRGGKYDQISSVIVFLLYSMPSFWVATMLIILAGSATGLCAQWFGFTLPYVNLHADNAGQLTYLNYLWDHLLHLVLPITAMTYGTFAFLSRIVRTSMLDVLGLDYIRTARAKGLSEPRVVGVHAFRNSLIPIVTLLGNLLPHLIGGSVIIENIFSIPGMGQLGFDAIVQRDYPVVMGTTTCAAVMTMLGILISDLLYCAVDPRIELQ